jgi:hypothetical protein
MVCFKRQSARLADMRFETMRTVLFLVAGKLDLSRFNENAR